MSCPYCTLLCLIVAARVQIGSLQRLIWIRACPNWLSLTPNNDKSNSGHPPVVATGSALESEGHDRTNIDFQGQQLPLIRALVGANPKTVVVLIHGGGIDLSWCKDNAAAILDACVAVIVPFASSRPLFSLGLIVDSTGSHYPGQMGGDAIFHSLLNYKGAGPAGRLTTTVYAQDFIARPMSDMSLRNITYKHYLGAPVYPFGYGNKGRLNVIPHSACDLYGIHIDHILNDERITYRSILQQISRGLG
eukprot:SAG31_NODE_1507_length_8072_cov_7.986580_4_plen_248_part_00